MIVETLLIPILNNVAGKLVENSVEKLRSSHEVNVLRAISRSRLLRELSLNLEVSKLLYAKRGSVASLEECKFKVLEEIMEGTLPLDYLLNHAQLDDPVRVMLCQDKSEKTKNKNFEKWANSISSEVDLATRLWHRWRVFQIRKAHEDLSSGNPAYIRFLMAALQVSLRENKSKSTLKNQIP